MSGLPRSRLPVRGATVTPALIAVVTGDTMAEKPVSTNGGVRMPTYVSLVRWTGQGVTNYQDTTRRAEDFHQLAESWGGRVRELLWTVGEYDVIAVAEFPDDETSAAGALQIGSLGNIHSNTMRAFTAEEMTAIIARTG